MNYFRSRNIEKYLIEKMGIKKYIEQRFGSIDTKNLEIIKDNDEIIRLLDNLFKDII